jgi:hypothetical protein
VAAVLTTACLVHWIEIQAGFGVVASRLGFFAMAGALLALSRPSEPPEGARQPEREPLLQGGAMAAALLCLAHALAGLASGAPAWGGRWGAGPLLALATAAVACLCVGAALLFAPRAGPTLRSALVAVVSAAVGVAALELARTVAVTASEPAAAAAAAAWSFRGLVWLLLGGVVGLGWMARRPGATSGGVRSWRAAAAVTLGVLGLAGAAGDRLGGRWVLADTLAKHGLTWLQYRSPAVGHRLLDEASRLDPGEPAHWMERGRVDLELVGEGANEALLEDAARSLERAIELAPLEPDAWANLGLARLLSADGSSDGLEQAAMAFDRALELRPHWSRVAEQAAATALLRRAVEPRRTGAVAPARPEGR